MSEQINKDSSCMDDFDPDALLPEQALEKMLAAITPVLQTEKIALRDALNRVLCTDIHSGINVPSGRNSAMDGYAIHADDIPDNNTNTLKLVGASFAGTAYQGQVNKGECVRIMTGAMMPAGTDTVVIQEHVEANGNEIRIGNETRPASNVRQAGEDMTIGDRVLTKGMKLTPADIGLLASLGIAEVEVSRKLKVAFFSTGDELRSIGEPLDDGMIYDSNRYTLYGMLKRLDCEIIDMGVVKDDRELMDAALTEATKDNDVLITSGGVSVGEADFVKEAVSKKGTVAFWKVAMKPGRPLTFGKLGETVFFGLPGNPVSVMVTFYQFVQPALRYFAGETETRPITLNVPCVSSLKKRPGRVEYQRGIVHRDNNGNTVVEKTGAQGSGILRSMTLANCFIILPLESEGVKPGDTVSVQLFHGLI